MPAFSSKQLSRRLVPLALAGAILVQPAAAQRPTDRRSGPDGGTWAGEAVLSGPNTSASLLHFSSPRWAIRAAVEAQGQSASSDYDAVSVLIGLRRYRGTGLGLRPVTGGGLLVSDASYVGRSIGGYVEAGAAWFFTPHLSLGVMGNASLTTGRSEGFTSEQRDRITSWRFSLARLTGAVYF